MGRATDLYIFKNQEPTSKPSKWMLATHYLRRPTRSRVLILERPPGTKSLVSELYYFTGNREKTLIESIT
jgi:hypothetical protein